MKFRTKFFTSIYCTAGLVFLISIAFNVFQYLQNKKLSKKIIAGKLETVNRQLSEELSRKTDFIDTWKKPVNRLPDPENEKSLRGSITKKLEEDYADLFKKLSVKREGSDDLMTVLIDQRMEIEKLYASDPGRADSKSTEEMVKELDNIHDEKITQILGKKKFKIYKFYKDRIYQRRILTEFMGTLPPQKRLSEKQEDSFINTMYEIWKDVNSETVTGASVKNEEKSLEFALEKEKAANKKYLDAFMDIMPSSSEQFEAFLKRREGLLEANMRISYYLNKGK